MSGRQRPQAWMATGLPLALEDTAVAGFIDFVVALEDAACVIRFVRHFRVPRIHHPSRRPSIAHRFGCLHHQAQRIHLHRTDPTY